MPRPLRLIVITGAIVAALSHLYPTAVLAVPLHSIAWVPNGFAIAPSDSMQVVPAIAADGAGGAYVLWTDYRNYAGFQPPVDAQHVTGAGTIATGWRADGTQLPWLSSEAGQIALADGAGGVFTATGGWDWYGHVLINHIGPDGEPVTPWPANGVEIALAIAGPSVQPAFVTSGPLRVEGAGPGDIMPAVALDGGGGLLVACTHVARTSQIVHVVRLTSAGAFAPGWPWAGTVIRESYASQFFSCICSDNSGGAFVAWYDETGVIIAGHVLGDGTIDAHWPSGGLIVSDAAHSAEAPGIVSDGQSGCFVTWQQYDAAGFEHPMVQHLLENGSPALGWNQSGLLLSTSPTEPGAFRTYDGYSYGNRYTYPSVVADGASGLIMAWTDLGTGAGSVHAQRVLGDGTLAPGWPAGGLAIAASSAGQGLPSLAADGTGGAFFAWQCAADGDSDVFAQHIDSSGRIASGWPTFGYPVGTGPGVQRHPVITADGGGGAIVAWENQRGGPLNIYAGRAYAASTSVPAEMPASHLALAGFRPNPSASGSRIAFTLASDEPATLELVDVAGRQVSVAEIGWLGPGSHVVSLDESHALPAGLYWMRLSQSGRTLTVRGVVVR